MNNRERTTIRLHLNRLNPSLGAMAIWMGYGYHFTELNNVPSILQNNVIYSRRDAALRGLIASEVGDPEILSRTAADVQEYVRFYWRPRRGHGRCDGARSVCHLPERESHGHVGRSGPLLSTVAELLG